MAMRCSSSRALVGALALSACLASAGCVQTITRSFAPSPSNPRFTPDEASRTLGTFLSVECDRLRQQQVSSGDATVKVDVDTAGMVTRAVTDRSSGNDLLDSLIGTVVVQLRTEPPANRRPAQRTVHVAYSCAEGREDATVTLPAQ
jgi:TonB family protein